MHDSAVLSCLHGCLVFLHKHFYHSILPHNILPSGHLASVSSRSCPGIAIQSLCSSSQLLCLLEAWVLVHSMDGCSKNFLCDSHSVYTVTDQLLPSQPQMLLLCPKELPHCGNQTPAHFPHLPRAGPVLLTLLFLPLLSLSY